MLKTRFRMHRRDKLLCSYKPVALVLLVFGLLFTRFVVWKNYNIIICQTYRVYLLMSVHQIYMCRCEWNTKKKRKYYECKLIVIYYTHSYTFNLKVYTKTVPCISPQSNIRQNEFIINKPELIQSTSVIP